MEECKDGDRYIVAQEERGFFVRDVLHPIGTAGPFVDRLDRPQGEYIYKTRRAAEKFRDSMNDGWRKHVIDNPHRVLEHREFLNGRRFIVIRSGAKLFGMRPIQGGQQGWGMDLHIGTVLTCTGPSMTWGDGVQAIKWADENGHWLANDCIFEPTKGGMWGGQVPADGYLAMLGGPYNAGR